MMVTRNNLTDVGREIAELRGQTPQLSGSPKTYYVMGGNPLASDLNDGLSETKPFNTIEGAIRTINQFRVITAPILVRIYPHETSSYTWTESLKNLQMEAPVVFYGVGDTVLASGTISGTPTSINIPVEETLTIDEFRQKTLHITSGALAGYRRSVRNNTAGAIVPQLEFPRTAPIAGDTYEIVAPAVEIGLPRKYTAGYAEELDAPPVLSNCGGYVDFSSLSAAQGTLVLPNYSSFTHFYNLKFVPDDTDNVGVSLDFGDSVSFLTGVTIDWTATAGAGVIRSCGIIAGTDRDTVLIPGAGGYVAPPVELAFKLGLAPTPFAWAGWGMDVPSGHSGGITQFIGFCSFNRTTSIGGAYWKQLGGSFHSTTQYTITISGSKVAFSGWGGASGAHILITNTLDATNAVCAAVYGSAQATLGCCDIIKTNRGFGVTVGCEAVIPQTGMPVLQIGDDTNITGITDIGVPTHAGVAYNGGVLLTRIDSSNTFSGWPVGSQWAVRTGLTPPGTLLVAADTSGITAGGCIPADGTFIHGQVRRYK